MIKSFSKEIDNAKLDSNVGIAIASLEKGISLNSYATRMNAGKKVSCHSHGCGDEWYIILNGEGEIYLADVVNDGLLINHRSSTVKTGDTFCISKNTAHQLKAVTNLDLIFLCPASHLSEDRTLFDDLC